MEFNVQTASFDELVFKKGNKQKAMADVQHALDRTAPIDPAFYELEQSRNELQKEVEEITTEMKYRGEVYKTNPHNPNYSNFIH